MGRKFEVAVGGRSLRVCVSAVDEAWELWICDATHRLALGQRIEIDDAVVAYRQGHDPVAAAGRLLASQLEQGSLALQTSTPPEPCPRH
jgi:hypothetical protein